MVPGLEGYRDRLPHSVVDGGYYTKTRENRPLIGPSPGDGIHLLCGLSGFGVMAAPGAGDLVARHITGETLPGYADAFLMSRYEDPAYLSTMLETGSGQL
jgi:glycine/D-amino acid oxidase-like deaminating enzyme